MKKYLVNISDLQKRINAENAKQIRNKEFYNIATKPCKANNNKIWLIIG